MHADLFYTPACGVLRRGPIRHRRARFDVLGPVKPADAVLFGGSELIRGPLFNTFLNAGAGPGESMRSRDPACQHGVEYWTFDLDDMPHHRDEHPFVPSVEEARRVDLRFADGVQWIRLYESIRIAACLRCTGGRTTIRRHFDRSLFLR